MARTIEEVRKSKRESMARRRAADPARARAYAMEHHYRNHDARKATMRAYYARRFFWGRAMKLRGVNRATTQDLARLWKLQRGRCALTGRRLDRKAQVDHVLPKARGGDDSASNLRWTCEAVNIAKRHMTDAEFMAICADVMHWIGKRIALVDQILTEKTA